MVSNQNIGFENKRHAPLTRKRTTDTPKTPDVSPTLVSQVIDVVRSSKGDCRSKLDLMDVRLSKQSVCEILGVLSCERVLALQFFEWVRDNNLELYRNGDICSLMADNCGWLNDYDTMKVLLEQFKDEKICLNDKAFGFLPVLDSSKAHAMESIASVIRVLDEIGGSVRNSGVIAIINMLCVLDSFESAKFVMEITEKKLNYYAILVREKCRRGNLEEARALIDEMWVVGCKPDSKIYNYILGSLCKSDKLSEALILFEEMKENGVNPDTITFEVFIANSCRLGRMEFANESLKRLMHKGYSPRVSAHTALVKGYFNAGRYQEAYEYVLDVEVKKIPATNKVYSLLARLHQQKGNIDVARRILDEMMEKGLKPDFLYYSRTLNVLRHTGGRDLAHDLQKKFSKFRIE